jgi:hypothetical protein
MKNKKKQEEKVVVEAAEVVEKEEVVASPHDPVLRPTIGRRNKPEDDGKIRDCWGTVMG